MKKTDYFNSDVEDALVEYKNANSKAVKDHIFTKRIYPAFSKLAENRIFISKITHNFPTYSYSDAKQDLVCFLYDKIEKFKAEKGKAFSYFDRVSINWSYAKLRDLAEDNYGRTDLKYIDYSRNIDMEVINENQNDELQEFCQKWSKWGNDHLNYFFFFKNGKVIPFNKEQRQVINAVFDLFEKRHMIDIYRKKALYILIREQVNVKTQTITDVVNLLKPLFREMFKDYKINGTKYWHRFLYYPEEIEGEILNEEENQ